MKIKKTLMILSVGILPMMSFLLPNKAKEASATDIGSDSMIQIILSTNGYSTNKAYIQFSGFTSKYELKEVATTSSTSKLFAINVRSSMTANSFKMSGDSFTFNSILKDTSNFYRVNSSTTGICVEGTYAPACRYIYSSASTRRMWFTFSKKVNGFWRAYNGSNTYMLHRIYNSYDDKDYFYVDVPSDISQYSLNYINVDAEGSNPCIPVTSRSNEYMHKIHYIDVDNKTISDEHILKGCDESFISEYIQGFVSCLDNDVNGYGAYPIILNVVSKYEGDTPLSEIFIKDYLESDYDDGYKSSSIRGGYNVSVLDKINEISANYNQKYNRFISINYSSNNEMVVMAVIGGLTLLSIGGYIVLHKRHIKHHF